MSGRALLPPIASNLPFHLFVFCGTFFWYVRRIDRLYEHVIAEHQISITTTIPQAPQPQHSTVQHSAVNPRDKQQIKYALVRRSQPARQAANQVRAGQAQSTRATSSRSSTRWSGRDNPGKQTDLARASMSSSIQPAVLSNRTKTVSYTHLTLPTKA